jgi:hypothetical protein
MHPQKRHNAWIAGFSFSTLVLIMLYSALA